jgi:hypothetical protein
LILKIATAVFAETLDYYQNSKLKPKPGQENKVCFCSSLSSNIAEVEQ